MGKKQMAAKDSKNNKNLNPQEVHAKKIQEYLQVQQQRIKDKPQKIAKTLTQRAVHSVSRLIRKGVVTVLETPESLEDILRKRLLLKEQTQEHKLKEQQKAIKNSIQFLKKQLHSKHEVEGSPSAKQFSHDLHVLTKEQHQERLGNILKLKLEGQHHHQKLMQSIDKRKEELFQNDQRLEQQKKSEIEARKQHTQQRLQKQQEMHQRLLESYKQTEKELNQVKSKKYLYEGLTKQPALSEQKRKLKQVRELQKSGDKPQQSRATVALISEIKAHEKEYLDKKEELISSRSKMRTASPQWNYEPPRKSNHLNKILEDEIIEQKRNLEEKERDIKQKLIRKQNFINYLKSEHVPTISHKNRKQIQERLQSEQETKELLLKRVSTEKRQLGLDNLREVKQMVSRIKENRSYSQHRLSRVEYHQPEKKPRLSQQLHKSPRFYEQVQEKRLDKIMSSAEDTQEKAHRLQRELAKLNERLQHKKDLARNRGHSAELDPENTSLILLNIKAKMGLAKLYQ